jgi:GH43 family beta-xylosidase
MRRLIESLERRCLLSGNGLVGYYYNDITETTRVMTRNDSDIDFSFGSAPPVPQMGSSYSIKWQAQILPPTTGVYTFYVDATDGVQLTVRGTEIINRASDGSGELSGTIPLSGGQLVDLELDYYNDTNNGDVHLYWSAPGISKQIVPNAVIYNTYGVNYTYTNPIAPTGQDPWVQYENGEYYYALSDGGALYVAASSTLEGIGTAPEIKIYSPPQGAVYSQDLWAPELHYINGLWYVYFAADDGNDVNHRMYVLQSTGQNPQGTYIFDGEIKPTADTGVPNVTSAFPTDHWAIDGTVVTIGTQNYFVWSGWDGTTGGQQNLYIALMSSPTTISGQRYVISEPTYSWETVGQPTNEGPEELQNGSNIFIIYSASLYSTNSYCLGQLKYNGTGNPLSQSSWIKNPTPVFQSDAAVVGVGHASFTTSPDGTQDWIVYHAHNTTGTFTGVRDVNIQQFTFNADGSPNFGSPVAPNTPLPEPSGTPHYTPAFNYPVFPTAPAIALPNITTIGTTITSTLTVSRLVTLTSTSGKPPVVSIVIPPPPPPPPPPVKVPTVISTVLQILPFATSVIEEIALVSANLLSGSTPNEVTLKSTLL